ncbi:MAG: prolyl oligopeptidase family serine peptidase [Chitinophagaceae bacterium]
MKKFLFLLFAIIQLVVAVAQNNWSPDQLLKIKNISSAQISPDGKKVVYALREAYMTEDRSEYVNQIWVCNSDGTGHLQLTKGDKNNSNPKWSPDNQHIAFVSAREGKTNLYIMSISGGEAEKITDAKGGVGDFAWADDGHKIAFLSMDVASDKEEKDKKGKSDWYYMDANPKQNRLMVLWIHQKDSTGKYLQKLMTKENVSINSFDWNINSKTIAYSYGKTTKANDMSNCDLSIVDITTGEVKSIANTTANESNPKFSPEGKHLAYVASELVNDWAGPKHVQIFSLSDGKSWRLKASPDEDGSIVGWTPDNKNILLFEAKKTLTGIYLLSADGKSIAEWTEKEMNYIANVSVSNGNISFILQNPSQLPELYMSAISTHLPKKITSINDAYSNKQLGKTELIRWKSFDGKEIEGLLTYPVNYQPGKKVPLLLNIHGGPAGVFSQSCIASNQGVYPLASLSENGFAVLRPNPRGSTGYGTNFRVANKQDWGMGDYQDVMLGVDAVIKMGVTDESMLGVMGWSYGGYLSGWIVGHTNRFKAASIGAPVVDLAFQNMTDDVESLMPVYFNGDPWDNWDLYTKHSPLRYVQNVKTPVMLQHGEADFRVPLGNSVMFYNALRRRGIPVKLLVLPRQPHGPFEPKMVMVAMHSNLDWFKEHLKK